MAIIKRFGWKPDLPDQRDVLYKAPPKVLKALPTSIDLRANMPPVFDQGDLGSCTANATAAQVWFLDKTKPAEPSRLFIYYNSRALEGTIRSDSGASIRDSIKSVVRWGFCTDVSWPYHIPYFTRKPSQRSYAEGRLELITQYARVPQEAKTIKSVLAQGLPVNFGFTVYESFEGAETSTTGVMPLPASNERTLGGHAVLIVGYDDAKEWYIVRNSWSDQWGDKGYFYMPYAFAHNPGFADDFWVVKAVP